MSEEINEINEETLFGSSHEDVEEDFESIFPDRDLAELLSHLFAFCLAPDIYARLEQSKNTQFPLRAARHALDYEKAYGDVKDFLEGYRLSKEPEIV